MLQTCFKSNNLRILTILKKMKKQQDKSRTSEGSKCLDHAKKRVSDKMVDNRKGNLPVNILIVHYNLPVFDMK